MDKGVYLYTVGEDVNWYSHKKSMKVSQKTENRTTIWSSNPLPGYISQGNENRIRRDINTFMLAAALFTGHRSSLNGYQLMNGKRKHGTYITEYCCCGLVAKSWLTLWEPMACQVPLPWNFPGKDTGMGCHFLLQGIFQPRDHELMSPALAGGFFTSEPPGKPTTEHDIAKKK